MDVWQYSFFDSTVFDDGRWGRPRVMHCCHSQGKDYSRDVISVTLTLGN